jgi:hypothetical protein
MKKKNLIWIPCLGLLGACAPMSHHIYDAKVLEPGKDQVAWGFNLAAQRWVASQSNVDAVDANDFDANNQDAELLGWHTISRNWRMGLWQGNDYFEPIEMAMQFELPTGTGFMLRSALPSKKIHPKWNTTLGGGWDLGLWGSNTLWAEAVMDWDLSSQWTAISQFRYSQLGHAFMDVDPDLDADGLFDGQNVSYWQTSLGFTYQMRQESTWLPKSLALMGTYHPVTPPLPFGSFETWGKDKASQQAQVDIIVGLLW